MKLYTTLYGECTFDSITNMYGMKRTIAVHTDNGTIGFMNDGRYDEKGECILFPSKDQRDWSKFEKPVQPPFEVKRTKGDEYSYIIDNVVVDQKVDIDSQGDDERWAHGNYFKTREQAEYAVEKVKELLLSMRNEAR